MDVQAADTVKHAAICPKKVRASVVVSTRNNLSCLSQCLETLYRTMAANDEIIVVVNGSEEENQAVNAFLDAAKKNAPLWTVAVDITPKAGFCAAANAGMEAARGKFIVLLDDDTIPTTGWLDHMLEALSEAREQFPEVRWGYIGPMTNAGAIPIQDLSQQFKQAKDPTMAEPMNYQLYHGNFRAFVPAGSLSGFCLLMTRTAYEEVGGFDEETFGLGGFETNDLLLRALEKEFLGAIATKVFVYHLGGTTINRVAPHAQGGVANCERFMKKWYKPRKKTCCAAYRVKIDTKIDANLFIESLQRMKKIVDWAVVYDVGSTIDVNRLAADHGFEEGFIRQYMKAPKNQKPDETQERNILLKMARRTGPDWIWVADSDEWPDEKLTRDGLQRLMNPQNPLIKCYTAPIFVCWKSRDYVRVDGNWSRMNREVLFRNCAFGNIHSGEDQVSCRRIPTLIPQDGAFHTGAIMLKNLEYADPKKRAGTMRRLISDDDAATEDETPVALSPYIAPSITYLLMGRNESKDILRHIFNHFCWLDDFRVVDTGSIDDTAEVCETFDVPYTDFRCCEEAEDPQHMLCHFGNARNFSIEQCATDYILFMDPDEKLNQVAIAIIPRLVTEQRDGYAIEIYNYRRVAGGDVKVQQTMQPRLFRNREEIRYEPDIHETLEESFTKYPKLTFEKVDGPIIEHEGFLRISENSPKRKWKNEQYMKRLFDVLERDPNDARAMYSLSQHLISVGEVDDGDALLGKAVAANPNFFHARFALANRLIRRAHQLLMATPKGSIQYKEKKIIVERMLHDLGQWCDVGS